MKTLPTFTNEYLKVSKNDLMKNYLMESVHKENKVYGWYAYTDWPISGRIFKDVHGQEIYVTCVSTSKINPCSNTTGLNMVGEIDSNKYLTLNPVTLTFLKLR